jgi:hypothetical protein
MKSTLKYFLFCVSFFMTASLANAQSFPQWDITPNVDPNFGSASSGPIVGQGEYLYIISDNAPGGESGNYYIERWSVGGGWQTLGAVNVNPPVNDSSVSAIAVQSNYVYIVGNFESVGDGYGNVLAYANDIAKYNLSTYQWSAVGNDDLTNFLGETSAFDSMILDSSGNIYLGISGDNPNILVEWNHTSTNWIEVGHGFSEDGPGDGDGDGGILALTTDGTNIFAAGGFTAATNDDGTVVGSDCVIKWDGSQFETVGVDPTEESTNFPFDFTLDGFSIAVAGTNVFVTGGFRYTANGTTNYGIARFSSKTGAVLPCANLYKADPDVGYQPGVGYTLITKDGNVYLSGGFTYIGTDTNSLLSANGIAMWASDGSSTGTWTNLTSGLTHTLSGSTDVWEGLLAADDNSVFVSGSFNFGSFYVGGIYLPNDPYISRWMTSRDIYVEVDTNFNPSAGEVMDMTVQNDETVLAVEAGYEGAYEGVYRFNPDGTSDSTFDSDFAAMMSTNLITDLFCVGVDSAHRIYVGGDIQPDENVYAELIRLTTNCVLDSIAGAPFIFTGDSGQFSTIAGGGREISSGADILAGGYFNAVGQVGAGLTPNYNLVAIYPGAGGGVDSATNNYPGMAPNDWIGVWSILEASSPVVGGGLSSSYGDHGIMNSVYPSDWALGSGNTFSGGVDGAVYALASETNSDIVAGGDFTTMGSDPGGSHYYLGRFNNNGTVDESFNPTVNGPVNAVFIQSDGKIWVGEGANYEGDSGSGLYRFNLDGTMDTNFNIQINSGGAINKIIQQADGEILVGGNFTVTDLQGQVHTNLVRFIDHP